MSTHTQTFLRGKRNRRYGHQDFKKAYFENNNKKKEETKQRNKNCPALSKSNNLMQIISK
jgi:disulfide oxidoreductase YuzD